MSSGVTGRKADEMGTSERQWGEEPTQYNSRSRRVQWPHLELGGTRSTMIDVMRGVPTPPMRSKLVFLKL